MELLYPDQVTAMEQQLEQMAEQARQQQARR